MTDGEVSILQDNWPGLFKNIHVVEDRSRGKDAKETWRPKATKWNLGSCLDLAVKKNKQNPCELHNNNWGNLNMDENITISVLIFLGVIMVCVPQKHVPVSRR